MESSSFEDVLTCLICLDTVQLPVMLSCFKCPSLHGKGNPNCMRASICLLCAQGFLQLSTPKEERFRESNGKVRCLICRDAKADATKLTLGTSSSNGQSFPYLINHGLMTLMDALLIPASCSACPIQPFANQSQLLDHLLNSCPSAAVPCKYQLCSFTTRRSKVAAHEATCAIGKSKCLSCSEWVEKDTLFKHMLHECRLRVVDCPICGKQAKLTEMVTHLKEHQAELQQQVKQRLEAATGSSRDSTIPVIAPTNPQLGTSFGSSSNRSSATRESSVPNLQLPTRSPIRFTTSASGGLTSRTRKEPIATTATPAAVPSLSFSQGASTSSWIASAALAGAVASSSVPRMAPIQTPAQRMQPRPGLSRSNTATNLSSSSPASTPQTVEPDRHSSPLPPSSSSSSRSHLHRQQQLQIALLIELRTHLQRQEAERRRERQGRSDHVDPRTTENRPRTLSGLDDVEAGSGLPYVEGGGAEPLARLDAHASVLAPVEEEPAAEGSSQLATRPALFQHHEGSGSRALVLRSSMVIMWTSKSGRSCLKKSMSDSSLEASRRDEVRAEDLNRDI